MALTKLVASEVLFQNATLCPLKLVPLSVRVKPTPPAVVDVGEMLVRVGALPIVNGSVGGEGWPTATTPTCATPGDRSRFPGMVANIVVELENWEVIELPLKVTPVFGVKPLPVNWIWT